MFNLTYIQSVIPYIILIHFQSSNGTGLVWFTCIIWNWKKKSSRFAARNPKDLEQQFNITWIFTDLLTHISIFIIIVFRVFFSFNGKLKFFLRNTNIFLIETTRGIVIQDFMWFKVRVPTCYSSFAIGNILQYNIHYSKVYTILRIAYT